MRPFTFKELKNAQNFIDGAVDSHRLAIILQAGKYLVVTNHEASQLIKGGAEMMSLW